jgi:hypothetical protein
MGAAGHHRFRLFGGAVQQRADQRGAAFNDRDQCLPRIQTCCRGDLVVATASGMHFFADITESGDQATLDRRVAVLIAAVDFHRANRPGGRNFGESCTDLIGLVGGNQADVPEHTRVGDACRRVRNDQRPVEEVIPTHGKPFHRLIEAVAFVPEFCHQG